MDQCTHCASRGDYALCKATPCGKHEDWIVQHLAAALEEVERLKREVDHYKRGEEKSFAWDAKCLRRLATLVGVSTPESDETLCLTAEATIRHIYRVVHDQLAAAQSSAKGEWERGFMSGVGASLVLVDCHGADTIYREIVQSVGAEDLWELVDEMDKEHLERQGFKPNTIRAEANQPAQGEGAKEEGDADKA